jgi:hypothetical protein
LIGVDFDNTIVCYDGVFDAAARERGVIESGPTRTKGQLRDELRAQDREDEWTELQGYVYGPGMELAHPFDGALEFLRAAVPDVAIVSHRTRHPYAGPEYDLHAAARDWLRRQDVGLPPEAVHLVETREEKFERIRHLRCTTFIDDLPEFLTDPEFPDGVERVLFDPHGAGAPDGVRSVGSWGEAAGLLR